MMIVDDGEQRGERGSLGELGRFGSVTSFSLAYRPREQMASTAGVCV
jgi:hypothetical protein